MIRLVTHLGIFAGIGGSGWAIFFERAPGQMYPGHILWPFYLMIIPLIVQCWILTRPSFWSAKWERGIPVSSALEKECEQYMVLRGICKQNRKFFNFPPSAKEARQIMYKLHVSGASSVFLAETIKIKKLIGYVAVITVFFWLPITFPEGPQSIKRQLVMSWPVSWFCVVLLQLVLFAFAMVIVYWVAGNLMKLIVGRK